MPQRSDSAPPEGKRPSPGRPARMVLWMLAFLLLAAVLWAALFFSGAVDGTRALVIVAWVFVLLNIAVRIWTRRRRTRR